MSAATPAAPSADLVLADRPADGVLLLRINRPAKANSLSRPLVERLCGLLREAAADDSTRCVVLTGSDRIFSAGADIAGMVEQGSAWYDDPVRLASWAEIQDFPKPMIAAVSGPAIGGGCELAMLCDIIVAAETASFAQGEINIGALPGDGGTQRLPRTVGKSLAMQIILSGQAIPAQQACQAGLVSEVVSGRPVVERAIEIASQIATHAPLSLQLAKRAVLAAFSLPLAEGLAFEHARVMDVFLTRDREEGMKAFLEKRKPVYQGR